MSIVGALIIGDAAVSADISPAMVIVTALTVIASLLFLLKIRGTNNLITQVITIVSGFWDFGGY